MKSLYTLLLWNVLVELFSSQLRKNDETGLISVEFSLVSQYNLMIVPITLGTPEKELSLIVDIGGEKTWVLESLYPFNESSTYKDLKEEFFQNESIIGVNGTLGNEDFKINTTELEGFHFLKVKQIETGNKHIEAVLSLGRQYEDKSYSFVYRLTSSAGTFFNAFSLKFIDNLKGRLLIGDLSDELLNEQYIMDTCKLVTTDLKMKWACNLTHIFIGDIGNETEAVDSDKMYRLNVTKVKAVTVNKPATFETIVDKILFPFSETEKYKKYFEDNYFINTKGEKICETVLTDSSLSFTCTKDNMNELKQMNFVFDGQLNLFLSPLEIFNCYGDICYALFGTEKEIDHYIMGITLLERFHTVFDYSSKDLTFHGKTNKAKVTFEEKIIVVPPKGGFEKFLIVIGCIFGVVLFVGAIYFFITRKKTIRKQIDIEKEINKNDYEPIN